nr:retrovirus-related Pol polyprotein from transposon TNT 1-94 [Tanacetum cinerariifolium]
AGYLTDADNLKSQTGYVFVLNGGAVDWKSAKQSIFATSSAEAEYIAAFDASKEAVWVRTFISGLNVVPTIEEPISMYCDNTRAIAIANESEITKGARYFRAKVYYLRKGFDVKLIDINRTCEVTKVYLWPGPTQVGMKARVDFVLVISAPHTWSKWKIRCDVKRSSALTTFGAANSSIGRGNMDRNSLIPVMYSDDRSFVAVKPRIINASMKWPRNDQNSTGKTMITNGIDVTERDPSSDVHITSHYTINDLSRKGSDVRSRDFVAEQMSLKEIEFHKEESPWTLVKSADPSFDVHIISHYTINDLSRKGSGVRLRDFVAEQVSLKGIEFHTEESPWTLIKSADGSFSLKLIKEQPGAAHKLCVPQDASRIQSEGDLLKLTPASFIEINSIVIESDQCRNEDWLLILAFSLGSDYVYLVYKIFKVYLHVDRNTKSSTVTWTVEYDKLSEDVRDPDSLLEFTKNVIKYV